MFRSVMKICKTRDLRCKRFISILNGHTCAQHFNKQTYFGFERVTTEEKSKKVHHVFTNVAQNYDLMNDVLSAGIHRCWKRYLIKLLDPYNGTELLDVAGGTGDVAFAFTDHSLQTNQTNNKVIVCDINADMLKVGQKRARDLGFTDIEWVEGDAQCLPFQHNSFDAYTIAFGIRNVVDIEKALSEAYRVLRVGAIFICLEFSHLTNPVLEGVYDWYSFEIIPVLGEILARDWNSYQYLVESIRQFPDQQDFKSMIECAGFGSVRYINLMQGIAAIHIGFKK